MRCLMPGARPSIKPSSAGESSGSSLDDVSQLERHLQRQLEEDVARIFDESIYSDLEVVCGKLKILTHSCILKARTHKFYHKLEAILHVNIGRNTFDEIYSFISDAYTECDIQHQENEIIRYLNEKLDLKTVAISSDKRNNQEEFDESDAYATPNCISPEENSLQKSLSSSPSTELNKEYYSLVPIEGPISDKELIEQDELSSAFKSFLHLHTERFIDNSLITQCIKPTSLSLNSSHISKINKHSILCDISKDLNDSNSFLFEDDKNKINDATSQVRKHLSEVNKSAQIVLKRSYAGDTAGEYSPDSLVADEQSSSSDYLSAALSASPAGAHAPALFGGGGVSSGRLLGLTDTHINMSNTFTTVSDSGIDNNGMLESINSHKDVTLTDISLTESTFHELLNDDAVLLSDSASEALKLKTKPGNSQLPLAYRTSNSDMSGRTSKDEKQRLNEEIVILESSSLSSETGSWESVFPPKMPEKDLCEMFLNRERQFYYETALKRCRSEIVDIKPDSFEYPRTTSVKDTFEYPSTSTVQDTFEYPSTTTSVQGTFEYPSTTTVQRTFKYPSTTTVQGTFEYPSITTAQGTFEYPSTTAVPDTFAYPSTTTVQGTFEYPSTTTVQGTFKYPSTTAIQDSFEYPSTTTVPGTFEYSSTTTVQGTCEYPSTTTVQSTFEYPSTTPIQGSFEYPSTNTVQGNFEYPNTTETSTTYKSTCCFIDASSLADVEDRQQQQIDIFTQQRENNYRSSTQPLPCEPKKDISPNNFSESNDNEDSLEQPDPDSIQKDLSPTIFEMTLAGEDSATGEVYNEDKMTAKQQYSIKHDISTVANDNNSHKSKLSTVQTVFMTTTPNNSIISLKASDFTTYDSEQSLKLGSSSIDKLKHRSAEIPISPRPHTIRQDILEDINNTKYHESSPIISGGASIEDHLPQSGYSHSGSPMPKRKLENIPIVSGAYIPPSEDKIEKTPKASSCAAAWVVDMSKMSQPDAVPARNKKPGDKTCDSLKASSKSGSNSEGCKSRSSVDSDSSEKSTHKFYIDLSTLPDALSPEQNNVSESNNEKKNIFSMFIDLGENSPTVKEMPARLSSSLNIKKTSKSETKPTPPGTKTVKPSKKCSNVINGDETFEKLETLCDSSEMSISEILQNPIAKKIVKEHRRLEAIETQDYHPTFTKDGIAPTITEEPDTDQFCDSFVRLSDLDRAPANKSETTRPKTECFVRMTRSIPDNNWGESSHASSRSIDIISSFHSENALSLNRLFPHLKNDISRSMPGSLSGRTRSPFRLGDREELPSDVSEISSVQSSMCRSVVENSTTEDTSHTSSLLINCQSRLGQDLLRMFMEEIAPDVIVEVSGRRIKAHKCILSSRCQYFAGILSGGWVESAGNVISLPPFSFSVVHFALCHIYSGISTIPDSISIVELATIADMLGLEGLKEAIMFTLKAKYCHHFHEPCQVCTAGVLECFPLSSVYGLDELYRRCLRWITRHFRKVWPTKAFATLPSELLDKCYQEHLLNLTADNLVDTVYDCGMTVASLHRCRWAEVVGRLCRRLSAAAAQWAAARLAGVARGLAGARGPAAPAAARALDDCLAAAVDAAPPDQLCRTLAYLHAVHEDKPDLIAESAPHADRLSALRRRVEGALLRAAPRAVDAPSFRDLPAELRRRLRDLSRVDARPPPRITRSHPDTYSNNSNLERVRASFVPYAPRPQRNPPAPLAAVAPRVRTTKAQEERAKFNLTKAVVPVNKSKQVRLPYGNAKARYLEPRGKEPPAAVRKPLTRLVSSSESSRNSSPLLAPRRVGSRPRTADPSTDSLSDSLNTNKYATYTKPKRTDPPPPSMPKTQKTTQIKTKVTKIPIYQNQNSVPRQTGSRVEKRGEKTSPAPPRARASLMMATKSSSAKMVHKPVKDTPSSVPTKPKKVYKRTRSPSVSDIPVMERSGTFLKDEPTFGDKTTNIDIGE